jgi:formylglycine-generating enzyme
MKTTLLKSLRFLFAFCVAFWFIPSLIADDSRLFRILGPTAVTIAELTPDGYITWTNAQIGTSYTVQTARGLGNVTNWVDYAQVPVSNAVTTARLHDPSPPSGMVFIPAGSFTMGDTLDGESDASPTNVYVSAFYMDANLVSLSQWQTIYNYARSVGYDLVNWGSGKAPNHPVHSVSWYECVMWCNARSQQAGLTPVYCTDAGLTQVYTNQGGSTIYPNWTANGYRLPTEAEWEKAARGGLSGQRFPWGPTISERQANYYSYWASGVPVFGYDVNPYSGYNTNFNTGSQPYTSPVGYFAPNGYGLYDMAGNVREWCWDWYGVQYGQPTTNNPTGPASGALSGDSRVFRGGCWYDLPGGVRCAGRNYAYIATSTFWNGFRCVRGH